jgi:hypothetical protein
MHPKYFDTLRRDETCSNGVRHNNSKNGLFIDADINDDVKEATTIFLCLLGLLYDREKGVTDLKVQTARRVEKE